MGGQREKVRGVYGFVESLTLLSQRLNARRERVLSSRAEGRMKVRVGKGF